MSREGALEKAIREEAFNPPENLRDFLEAIHVSQSEWEEACRRNFTDIPNLRTSKWFRMAKYRGEKTARFYGSK
jgi:hypothetical protein